MTDWRFPQPLTHRGKPPNSPICSGDLPDRFTRFLLVHVSCAGCVCALLCVWLTFVSQRPARCGEKIPVMPLFCLTVNSAAAINLFMHIAVSSTVRWNLAPLTAFTESSLFAQDAHWEPLDSFSREKKKQLKGAMEFSRNGFLYSSTYCYPIEPGMNTEDISNVFSFLVNTAVAWLFISCP